MLGASKLQHAILLRGNCGDVGNIFYFFHRILYDGRGVSVSLEIYLDNQSYNVAINWSVLMLDLFLFSCLVAFLVVLYRAVKRFTKGEF